MIEEAISNNLLYSQKHFDLLLNLNRISLKNSCPTNEIYDLITESVVNGLDIDRASYWLIENEKLVCINLFDISCNSHIPQHAMLARDFPVYFKALSDGIAIIANDAKTNDYTKEFKDNYLIPQKITNMLDLPIRENGNVIGVLCCENKDANRIWSATDFAFARSIADLLTLLLEQNKNNLIQEKLIESERKLNLIAQNSTDGFVVIEARKITYMSPSYLDFFGHTFEQVSQFTVEEMFAYFHPDDRESVFQLIHNNLETKSTHFVFEFRLKLKDGTYKWRENNATVLYDSEECYSKIIMISRDVNASKENKTEIEKLYGIAKIQNEKLVNFTYIVSHNIRSNSCNISMLLDLIKDTDDATEKQNYYELLKISNDKLAETLYFLNETINVQNNHNTTLTYVNIKNVVTKIIQNHLFLKENENEIVISIPDDLEIKTIPSYLESILYNLISNAIKYKAIDRKCAVQITANKTDNITLISVKDNGIGINLEKNENKLFGMYKTFHGNEDAVGLGLYMTKIHVEHLNGNIDVTSEVNKGSTFNVTFHEQV